VENLEVDRFLDSFGQPKLNQGDINQLNRCITNNKVKAWIESCNKDRLGHNGFTTKFYHISRDELIPVLLKLFCEIEREGTVTNSFYEANISLIPKSDKDTTKKEENCRLVSLMNIGAKDVKVNMVNVLSIQEWI
jgi:hypothetical protein